MIELVKQPLGLKKKLLSTKQLQNNNFQIGFLGETCAVSYLESKGYTILARNISWKKLEIDIVATLQVKDHTAAWRKKSKNTPVLHFVEVKTRSVFAHRTNTFPSYLAYTQTKKRALLKMGNIIAKQYQWAGPLQFDLVTIDLPKEISTCITQQILRQENQVEKEIKNITKNILKKRQYLEWITHYQHVQW